MLFSCGPSGHAIFTPTSESDVASGSVVFSLTGRRFARVGEDPLLDSLLEFFAVAQSDLLTIVTADALIVLHLVVEELV